MPTAFVGSFTAEPVGYGDLTLRLRPCLVWLLLAGLWPVAVAAQDLVFASGAGSPPTVSVRHRDGTQTSFYAYDPAFSGGVRVALGDVDGDGVPDIITGAGPTGGPHVEVFSGKDFALLASFYAYNPAFTGGVYVAAGDVNGDGRADIITGAGAGGGPHVEVFSGADLSMLASFFAYGPSFTGGVRVAAGDINGDGHADIITGAGPGGGPHVEVFSGADLSMLASFLVDDRDFTGGVFVASGDFDDDGYADIVTGTGAGAGPVVQIWSGARLTFPNARPFEFDGPFMGGFYAYDRAFTGGVEVGAVDVNGDGHPEIITGAGPGGGPHVEVFRFASFQRLAHRPEISFSVLSSFYGFDPIFTGGVFVGSAPGIGSLRINSPPSSVFTVGSRLAFNITAIGSSGGITLTETGALPGGLTFADKGNRSATLTGTPAEGSGGMYPLTLTATDRLGKKDTQSFALFVYQAPAITSAKAVSFTPGAVNTFTVSTSGYVRPQVTVTGDVPAGVMFTDNGDGTGTLSGTPAAGTGGPHQLTITAANGVGNPATQVFTLTVSGPATFTSVPEATFTVGNPNSFIVTSSAVPNAVFTADGILPPDVSFVDNGNSTATIAGVPAANTNGSYPLIITATTPFGSMQQNFILTVSDPSSPIITTAASATFNAGAFESFTVTTVARPAAGAIEIAEALPAGLTFVNNGDGTATLSGRPTPSPRVLGFYPLTITASNPGGSATQVFSLYISPVAGGAPTITSANTTTFVAGTLGSFTITSTGTPNATLSAAGLPAGLALNDNGDGTATLTGTPFPGSADIYPLTITASNGTGWDAVQNFTLNIVNGATGTPLFTSAPGATFTIGVAGTFDITTAATPTAGSMTYVGFMAPGLDFVDNHDGTATLIGAPRGEAGLYPMMLTASGPGGTTTQSFMLRVLQSAVVTSATSATFSTGTFSAVLVTSVGAPTAALTETIELPAGIVFVDIGNGTATLSGTPAPGSGGAHALTFAAINGVGTPGTQSFTLNINDAGRFTSADTASLTAGSQGSVTITTESFPVATAITIGGDALPSGVTFTDHRDGTATLDGMPALGTEGHYAITFTFDNGVDEPVTQSFTLTVDEASDITTTTLTRAIALFAGIVFVA